MPLRSSCASLRRSTSWWVFLFALGVRLLVLVRFSHSHHFLPDGDDMKFYSDWALRIAHGQLTDGQAFYGLPGYAYALGMIFRFTGFDPFLVGLLQGAMDAGIAVTLYRLCQAVFAPGNEEGGDAPARGHWIGLAAAGAWIAFTPAQAFSSVLMPTVWLVLTFYWTLSLLVRTRSSTWWNPWLPLGFAAGMMATMVATILFLAPLVLISIVRTVGKGEAAPANRAWRVAAACAGFVAMLYAGASPAWMHNYFIAHEPVMLSAHSGINFWIGNNPTANGYPKMPPGIRSTQDGLLRDSITLAEEAEGRKMKRAEVSKYWSAKANAYIRANFTSWLRLMSVKFANFWNAYQYDDLSIIKLLRDEGILPPGLRFGFLAALGLAGMVPVCLRFPLARWVAAAVLLHMAAVLTVFVTERYRLAAAPGLAVLGAGGLWQFWHWLAERRWLPAGAYAALAVGAAWFVSTPRGDTSLWSLDHYKAGIRATAVGDLDRAQRNLETAYAYVQTNADINFALGNVWLERAGRTSDEREKMALRTKAKIYYRRALDCSPKHAGTLNNLGVLALEEKRYDLAEKFFAGSVATEPEAAKTHFLLARARFEQGKLPEARAALAEALQLRPGQPEFLELERRLGPAVAPAP